jgi:hypothetical protein
MSIFARPHYASDVTRFIDELKKNKPTLEAEQRAGRARLWDKEDLDRDLQGEFRAGRVPQKPYPYQTDR